jgi:AcrR family transcriptional regulator
VEAASPTRSIRADARRNRERVLAAARACFAEQGRIAQMDDVARRAGVGVGTVYRHFPDKASLLEALVAERFAEFAALGRAALEHEDPWEGFSRWLFACGELQADDRAFCDSMTAGIAPERTHEIADQVGLFEVNEGVVDRGRRAGVIRKDARADDIPLIMGGVAATALSPKAKLGWGWRRHLAIALDGMRAPAQSKLPD